MNAEVTEMYKITKGNEEMYDDLAELYNACSRYDNPDHTELTGNYFRRSYSHHSVDIERDIYLVWDGTGLLIARGSIIPKEDDSRKSGYVTIEVRVTHRNKGIGTEILERITRNARKRAFSKLICHVPDYRPYTEKFVEKHGFRPKRAWIKLAHFDIGSIDHPQFPKGFDIREVSVNKEAQTYADLQNLIFRSSFNYTKIDDRFLTSIAKHSTFLPRLTVFGISENQPVAYCIGRLFGSDKLPVKERTLRIDGIGVHPDYRGHRYGQTILTEVLARAADMGMRKSDLIVDSTSEPALRLYEKVGYEERYRRTWYSCYIG